MNKSDLAQFTGTEKYYIHWTGKLVYTDGINYLIEKGNCYWFIDVIASHQTTKEVREEQFQAWKLIKNEKGGGVITVDDGNDNIIATQELEYVDFPFDEYIVYCIDGVILLTSEY